MVDYPSIGDLLTSRKITCDEFMLLSFMIEEAGVEMKIKANFSRLAELTGMKKKRIAYLLATLRAKNWLDFSHSRGSRTWYYISLYVVNRNFNLAELATQWATQMKNGDFDIKKALAQIMLYKDLDLSDQDLKDQSPKPPLPNKETQPAAVASDQAFKKTLTKKGEEDDQDDSFDPEKIKSELAKTMAKVKLIGDAIVKTFPQITKPPIDMAIRRAIGEFRGDPEPILAACEALAPQNLDRPSPANALKYALNTAKGSAPAINYGKPIKRSEDPEIQEMEEWLVYCNTHWRSREDEIYPVLLFLSEKLEQPIEKVYAEREFLTAGKLEEYKTIYEKALGKLREEKVKDKFGFLYTEENDG